MFKIDKTTRNKKFDGLVGRVHKNKIKNSDFLNEIALSTRRRINSLTALYNEAEDKNIEKLIYKAIELEEKAAIDLGFVLEYEKFTSNRVRTKTTLPIKRLAKIYFNGDPKAESEIFFNKRYTTTDIKNNDSAKIINEKEPIEPVTKDKVEDPKGEPIIIKPVNQVDGNKPLQRNSMIIGKNEGIKPKKDGVKFIYIPNEYLIEFEKCLMNGTRLYVAGNEYLPDGSPNKWKEHNGLVGLVISITKDRMRIRAKSSFYNYSGVEDYTYYFGNNKDLDRLIMSQFVVPLCDSNDIVKKYSHIDISISPRRNYLNKIRNSNMRDFDNPKLYIGKRPMIADVEALNNDIL